MEVIKGKGRKANLIIQTWERCKSLGRNSKKTSRLVRSLHLRANHGHGSTLQWKKMVRILEKKRQVAPEGCFSVYVGPQKQRFVIKTEYANHPLFKILLEEAESEYGYNPQGPLALPCNVDLFYEVLVAMDDHSDETNPKGYGKKHCRAKKNGMEGKSSSDSVTIHNATIVTMDAESRVFRNGGIVIDQDKIKAIGQSPDIRSILRYRPPLCRPPWPILAPWFSSSSSSS
ncbi:hypothetical protein GH714_029981 [Hevea brasiliensis]|uniref:Uncharacterized protein n=1 Tax=Hevea brasiliensis TaxID=3981 RepID=A0A6A6KWB2_HEVBR|nr:hypothetical protein GH714_029981 [Hevea brasiliensis]